MSYFIKYKQILSQTILISMSRLILLIIPTLCLSVISQNDILQVSSYTLSSQYIQILIIILISLNIGSNIIIVKSENNPEVVNKIIFFMFILSILLSGIFSIIIFDEDINLLNRLLLLGIPFLSISLVFSSAFEASNKTSLSVYISIISLALTLLGIYVIENYFIDNLDFYVCLLITTIRIFQFLIGVFFMKRTFWLNKIKFLYDFNLIKKMMSFGISEMIMSILFTGSIFFSFFYLNRIGIDITYLSISFNYKSVVSIFFISYCISYSIYLSKDKKIIISKDIFLLSLYLYFIIYLIMYFSTNITSRLYSIYNYQILSEYLYISYWIILFDGIGLFLIFHLRVNDIKVVPPLFRLVFVFIGVPIGILLSRLNNDNYYYLVGILLGNLAFSIMIIIYYNLIKNKIKKY